MYSGYTYPITMKIVTVGMKAEIKPLERELTIIEASWKSLKILGTAKMYL